MKKKSDNKKESLIFTRETLGMTILLFCLIVLLCLFSNRKIFAGFGGAICTFMYGTFGFGCFFVVAALAYLGEWLAFEKKIKVKVRPVIWGAACLLCIFLLFHAVSTRDFALNSSYIGACYNSAANGLDGYTFGGVISALFVYPIAKIMTFTGAYIIFSMLVLFFGYMTVVSVMKHYYNRSVRGVRAAANTDDVQENIQTAVPQEQSAYDAAAVTQSVPEEIYSGQPLQQPEEQPQPQNSGIDYDNLGKKILFDNGEFDAESYRRNGIFDESSYFNHPVTSTDDYLKSFSDGKPHEGTRLEETYTQIYEQGVEEQKPISAGNVYYGDQPTESLEGFDKADTGSYSSEQQSGGYTDYQDENNDLNGDIAQQDLSYNKTAEPVEDNIPPVEESAENNDAADKPADDFPARDSGIGARSRSGDLFADKNDGDNTGLGLRGAGRMRGEQPDDTDTTSTNSDLYNLFGSGNSRLSDNSQNDDLRMPRGRERSNANLFDDNTPAESTEESQNGMPSGIDNQPDGIRGRGSSALFGEAENGNRLASSDRGLSGGLSPRGGNESRQADITPRVDLPRRVEPIGITPPVKEAAEEPKQQKPPHVWKKYVRPGLDLLDDYPEHSNINTGEIEDGKRVIVETLASFHIECEISDVIIGPAITRYDVKILDRTNIKNALKYKEAIAMALMKDNVNAYLNFAKGAVSIEVPNSKRSVIGLKTMMTSPGFINSKENSLTFALGKNVEGACVCPDITKMPHLLVAGATGSGKSICLSSLLISLLYKYGPEELRLILVDPKQVEFISYDKLPHLMINEIIYDVDKAIKALNWAIKEMEHRYALFKEMTESGNNAKGSKKVATKNLDEYNAHLEDGLEKLPKIVIILDEFGDLMLQAKKDIESRIIKLVQKARACGIHLILATQRPSVDCITGLIKSNLPTRIGFKVGSFDDSRTIFDVGGAEKLLGRGDMYFRSADKPDLVRIQGCMVDSHEVQKVTDFIKEHNETYFDESVSDFINKVEEPETSNSLSDGGMDNEETKIDDVFIQALKYCVDNNKASVSMLQRRFPIGYMKACKIIDWMENMNYITKGEGPNARKVLLSRDEFLNTYGEIDD